MWIWSLKKDQPVVRISAITATEKGKFSATAYIRLIAPLTHPSLRNRLSFHPMKAADLKKACLKKLSRQKPDALVVQRTAIQCPQIAEALIDTCKTGNIKLVYEIDDSLFNLPPEHPHWDRYQNILKGPRILLEAADLVTTSTSRLKTCLETMNPNVAVLPNALDDQLWLGRMFFHRIQKPVEKEKRPIRILYMGTKTHLPDLKLIEEPLRQTVEDYGPDRVQLEIIGIIPQDHPLSWAKVIPIPTSASTNYIQFVRWLRRRAHQWNIGIAPLQNNPFNQCKSAIKYLDYSALGLPTIASDVLPYQEAIDHGQNGLLADDTASAWSQALKSLIEDRDYRERLRLNAWQSLVARHTLRTQAQKWLDIYSVQTNPKKNP